MGLSSSKIWSWSLWRYVRSWMMVPSRALPEEQMNSTLTTVKEPNHLDNLRSKRDSMRDKVRDRRTKKAEMENKKTAWEQSIRDLQDDENKESRRTSRLEREERTCRANIKEAKDETTRFRQRTEVWKIRGTAILIGNVAVDFLPLLESMRDELKLKGDTSGALATIENAILIVQSYIDRRDFEAHQMLQEDADELAEAVDSSDIFAGLDGLSRDERCAMRDLFFRAKTKAMAKSNQFVRVDVLLPTTLHPDVPDLSGQRTQERLASPPSNPAPKNGSNRYAAFSNDSLSPSDKKVQESTGGKTIEDSKSTSKRKRNSRRKKIRAQGGLPTPRRLDEDLSKVSNSKEESSESIQKEIDEYSVLIESLDSQIETLDVEIGTLQKKARKDRDRVDQKRSENDKLDRVVVDLESQLVSCKSDLSKATKNYKNVKLYCKNRDSVADFGNFGESLAECISEDVELTVLWFPAQLKTLGQKLAHIQSRATLKNEYERVNHINVPFLQWVNKKKVPHVEMRNRACHYVDEKYVQGVLDFLVEECDLSELIGTDERQLVSEAISVRNSTLQEHDVTPPWSSNRRQHQLVQQEEAMLAGQDNGAADELPAVSETRRNVAIAASNTLEKTSAIEDDEDSTPSLKK